jgi:hypothetical protein
MADRYELVIEASGEVRDADGNLIEAVPICQTIEVSAEEAARIIEGQQL